MFPRMPIALMTLMIIGLLVLPAGAADLDTFALLDIVEGITITETTALNFGDVALNNGTLTVDTDGTTTDPNFLSFDPTNVSQGIFTIAAIAGSAYDITLLENVPVAGLTLDNFRINIDGAADEAGTDTFVAVVLANASSTLNVGADLVVDSTTASLGDGQVIGYRITVNFN
ncbi:MAG: DUF4402 domain-containing protein [Gemmatimonadales bacterium]|nr:DUF4402 domain-containing protein [Gemmatimonadales bacterium]